MGNRDGKSSWNGACVSAPAIPYTDGLLQSNANAHRATGAPRGPEARAGAEDVRNSRIDLEDHGLIGLTTGGQGGHERIVAIPVDTTGRHEFSGEYARTTIDHEKIFASSSSG